MTKPQNNAPELEQSAAPPATPLRDRSWSEVWHLPVLILGLLALVASVILALPRKEKDNFPEALHAAELLIENNDLDNALAQLDPVLKHLDRATTQQQARFHLLMGDLLFLQQRTQGWNKEDTHRRVIESYHRAELGGLALDGQRLQRLAHTHVALGQDAEAMKVLDRLRTEPAERRYSIVKEMIRQRLTASPAGVAPETVAPLVERFELELRDETTASRRRAERVWAAGLRAQLFLEAHDADRAVQQLLRDIMSFKAEGGDKDLAPLFVKLAQAYQQVSKFAEAGRYYAQAATMIDPTDPLNAEILVGQGEMALALGQDPREAGQFFTTAVQQHPILDYANPRHGVYLSALIGQGDCLARQGMHPQAIESFGQVVDLLGDNPRRPPRWVEHLDGTLMAQHSLAYDNGQFERALDYLMLSAKFHKNAPPAELIIKLADTHERIADAFAGEAEQIDPAGAQPVTGTDHQATRRLMRQQAAFHYGKAADFYHQHALAVTLDDGEHGQSLWKSATCYDKAQDWKKAIARYNDFVMTRSTDPRQLEAKKNLGLAYLADEQHHAAVEQFNDLVTSNPKAQMTYDSLVPLARALLGMGEVDQAKRVLLQVITDHESITPESPRYRDALVELGSLYHRLAEYEGSIERLSEAVERYGDDPDAPVLRFKLADSYRMSIAQLDGVLAEPQPQSRMLALQAERARRLEQAQVIFSQVISDLESRPAGALTPLLELYLRNAYFYRADAAYDLGRFEQAISLYDLAAKRWEQHPASLMALVQIVNAYCELGQIKQARVANERARATLKRLPDEVFDDPSLPGRRQHWQEWLRWTSELNLFADPQASVAE